jgi:hypothetical protein
MLKSKLEREALKTDSNTSSESETSSKNNNEEGYEIFHKDKYARDL